jgi:hypothetical protein
MQNKKQNLRGWTLHNNTLRSFWEDLAITRRTYIAGALNRIFENFFPGEFIIGSKMKQCEAK